MRLWLSCGVILSLSCGDQVVVRETQAACGNGQLEQTEQCDDGNTSNEDECTAACVLATCGDGVLRSDLGAEDIGFEACDDGNSDDNDGCTNACVIAACGDGLLRTDIAESAAGFEGCDDGNDENTDGCLRGCVPAR